MKYRIALHKSDEGYSVSVPGLPGCWSQGVTEEELSRLSVTRFANTCLWSMNSFVERMCAKSKLRCSVV
jgi:hypothetical protein